MQMAVLEARLLMTAVFVNRCAWRGRLLWFGEGWMGAVGASRSPMPVEWRSFGKHVTRPGPVVGDELLAAPGPELAPSELQWSVLLAPSSVVSWSTLGAAAAALRRLFFARISWSSGSVGMMASTSACSCLMPSSLLLSCTTVIVVFSFWYARMSLLLSESCGLVLDLCLNSTAPDTISLGVDRSTNLCRR